MMTEEQALLLEELAKYFQVERFHLSTTAKADFCRVVLAVATGRKMVYDVRYAIIQALKYGKPELWKSLQPYVHQCWPSRGEAPPGGGYL